MRASTAFFAGAGTVIAAIAGGFGGGLLIADIIAPQSPRLELTKLEQRMSSEPIDAKAEPSDPAPTGALSSSAAADAPAALAQPPVPTAVAPAAPPPADAVAVAPVAPSAPASQPAAQKQTVAAPEDAMARARDVDIKRATAGKRRSERRQQWSQKQRSQRRQQQELREVESMVREETEIMPAFAPEPARSEMPTIRLFGLD